MSTTDVSMASRPVAEGSNWASSTCEVHRVGVNSQSTIQRAVLTSDFLTSADVEFSHTTHRGGRGAYLH